MLGGCWHDILLQELAVVGDIEVVCLCSCGDRLQIHKLILA